MRGWLIGCIAGLAFAVGIGVGVAGYWGWSSGDVGGSARPAFSLPDLDGERRAISEWDGEVIVINFWATWCRPCREEIPRFVELQERFRDRGVQFVGVAIDRRSRAADFAEAYDINYPILYGMDRVLDVQSRYGNKAGTLPYTVVIDRDGFIRHIFPELVEDGELAPILASMAGST
jgi:peroxiredoxin